MELNIRQARKNDLKNIITLLENNNLPTADITSSSIQLFVGTYNNETVGVIGIEIYETKGLLRSLAVRDGFKKLRVGTKLVDALFNNDCMNNVVDVYLLTETAPNYFTKFNFKKVERSRVPDIIMQTNEFKELCPASATVMHKGLWTGD